MMTLLMILPSCLATIFPFRKPAMKDRSIANPHFTIETSRGVSDWGRNVPKVMVAKEMTVVHLPAGKRRRVGTNMYEPLVPAFAVLWDTHYRSRAEDGQPPGWTRDQTRAMRFHTWKDAVAAGVKLVEKLT